MDHPIRNLMETTLENLKEMVDVNHVVGAPIAAGADTIIPISKVSFGFVAGGGEYDTAREHPGEGMPFAGGSGAGISVQPVGFLVVGGSGVKMLPAQNQTAWERAVGCVPQLAEDLRALFAPAEKQPQEGQTK